MLQLRDKISSTRQMIATSRILKKIARRYRALFIVNDRLEVAAAAGADGVHIGRGDVTISTARAVLGTEAIIGASAGSLRAASCARADGADYIGVGPAFRTPIKPKIAPLLFHSMRLIAKIDIPVFAIGGITARNISVLKRCGISRVAVIRAISSSGRPFAATASLIKALAQ